MRVYSAHDGAMLDVAQPLRAFSAVSALADVVSLVTGIVADAVILITEDGAQLTDDLLAQLVDAHMLGSHSVSPAQIEPDLFVFSRDILSAEPELVAPSLQDPLVLQPPLNGAFFLSFRFRFLSSSFRSVQVPVCHGGAGSTDVICLSDDQQCKSFAHLPPTHCRI